MKNGKNSKITSDKISTPIGRIRGLSLAVCAEDMFGEEKKVYQGVPQNTYSVELLFPKNEKVNQEFFKDIVALEKMLMGDAFDGQENPHPVIKDGDKTKDPNYEGFYVFKLKRNGAEGRPLPINLNDRTGQKTTADVFYSGCWARAQFQLKTYEFKNDKGKVMSRGVTKDLLTLQFARDDDPIFSKAAHGDDLEAIESYDAETDELLG